MSRSPLAVVVPYRDRREHLAAFLPHLSRFLARARIAHSITVVEQADARPFNRGRLLNVGFDLNRRQASTFCFHDVDLLPLDDGCDYSTPGRPTHLAKYLSQFAYRVLHPGLFGGVNLFPRWAFSAVNGFSNGYWGWGGEDNDLLYRCSRQGLAVVRKGGRYRSLWHAPTDPRLTGERSEAEIVNDRRLEKVLAGELDWRADGLSDLAYTVRSHHDLGYGARLISVDG